jgi:hypothetical protein
MDVLPRPDSRLVGVHREDDEERPDELDIDCEEASVEAATSTAPPSSRSSVSASARLLAVNSATAVHQDRRRVLAPPSVGIGYATSASRTATKET